MLGVFSHLISKSLMKSAMGDRRGEKGAKPVHVDRMFTCTFPEASLAFASLCRRRTRRRYSRKNMSAVQRNWYSFSESVGYYFCTGANGKPY
jgi:hypothetical protein